MGFRFKIAPGLGQSGSQVRLYIRVFWLQLRGETELLGSTFKIFLPRQSEPRLQCASK